MKPSRLETPPYGNATKRNTAIYNVTQRQARSALSALESFAMEREDAVAKLSHEKEELLEELKGARSGQDRSAEEVGCLFACVLACLLRQRREEEKKASATILAAFLVDSRLAVDGGGWWCRLLVMVWWLWRGGVR